MSVTQQHESITTLGDFDLAKEVPNTSPSKENESLDTAKWTEVREQLVGTYEEKLAALKGLTNGESEKPKNLITVVVSVWEEDARLTSTKMFENSLEALTKQAETAGLDLDIIIVANNGGGKTAEAGDLMKTRLKEYISNQHQDAERFSVETSKPEGAYKPGTPWKLDLGLANERQGHNRIFVVEQPKDLDEDGNDLKTNAGKPRALRDVATSLFDEYTQGYRTDAIFQMDAETILMYAKETALAGTEHALPPLKSLYNKLTRGNLVAVGTRDQFEIIDPDTGKTRPVPADTIQQGFMQSHDRFIAIPGGAMMSKPEEYIAGMIAITDATPSTGAEDYEYTQLLRFEAQKNGEDFNNVAQTLFSAKHLNRATEDEFVLSSQIKRIVKGDIGNSSSQINRWLTQSRAINNIFPELDPYVPETVVQYAVAVIRSRLTDFIENRDTAHLKQLLIDATRIPEALKVLTSKDYADILGGSPVWGHTKETLEETK